MIKLQNEEFQILSRYIREITGIHLDSSKSYLVENRFQILLQQFSCTSYGDLYHKARNDATRVIQRKIIDAITTGETLFFRDTSPFELLQHKLLPDLIDRKTRAGGGRLPLGIRIWSAACSTGQEIYSIAIVLKELLGDLSRYSIRLVGTDISDQAIATASRGIFNKIEIERGLPKEKLQRYFTAEGDCWKIKDDLRSLATFRHINLQEDFSSLGAFDIIFCRNVAIYFSEEDKARVFTRMARALDPEGCLIIGSTETLNGVCPLFESNRYLRSVFYKIKK